MGSSLFLFWIVGLILALAVVSALMGLRYIANNRVGVVEKLWSSKGSVQEGRIMALNGEAGFQAELLRGGVHFGLWRWQYRIHKLPLVMVPQGKIGYVYARDGVPLAPGADARPGRRLQQLPGRPRPSCSAAAAADPEQDPRSASAAGSGRSSARASTPSTWRSSM